MLQISSWRTGMDTKAFGTTGMPVCDAIFAGDIQAKNAAFTGFNHGKPPGSGQSFYTSDEIPL